MNEKYRFQSILRGTEFSPSLILPYERNVSCRRRATSLHRSECEWGVCVLCSHQLLAQSFYVDEDVQRTSNC